MLCGYARTPRLELLPTVFLAFAGAVTLVFVAAPGVPLHALVPDLVRGSVPLAVLVGVRHHAPVRRLPWYLLAAGSAVVAAGDVVFDLADWNRATGMPAFPSTSDALYVVGYALLAAGFLQLGIGAFRATGRTLLDYAVIASTGFLVVFTLLVDPVLDRAGHGVFEQFSAIVYPSIDAVLFLAVVPLALCRLRVPSVFLLVLFVLGTFATDVLFGVQTLDGAYTPGGPLDAGWILASGALGAGALHPSMRAASNLPLAKSDDARRFTAMGVVLVVVFVQLATLPPAWNDGFYVPIAFSALIIGLSFARVAALVREQERTKRRLELQVRRLDAVDAIQHLVVADVDDVREVLEDVCAVVAPLTGASDALVELVEEGELRVLAAIGRGGFRAGAAIPRNSLAARAIEVGEVLLSGDVPNDPRIHPGVVAAGRIHSVAAAPVFYGGAAIGALVVLSERRDAFGVEEARTLELMASMVSVAVNRNADFASRLALDSIVGSVEDGIITRDLDGRILTWNEAAERIYGYEAGEIVGQTADVLLPPERKDEYESILAALRSGRASVAYESERIRKDGRRIAISVISTAVRDSAGGIRRVTTIVRDVTERNELAEQLNHAQKMEAIGRLAGGVAHDFNNLLVAMGGYASFIEDDPDATDRIRLRAGEIRSACRSAADLTTQLLAYSRRQILRPARIEVNEVVDETRRLLERLIGDDVELACRLCPSATTVIADRGRLQQVMMNLGVNARDAMPEGGRLTIETTTVDVPSGAGGLAAGRYVRLSVSDDGVGMDDETRARIFEPFFTTKGEGRGTGLGLAMVYGTVKQSGGHLTVESAPGAGTTFAIHLPMADPAVAEDGAAPAGFDDVSRGDGRWALVVEDQAAVREVVAEMLAGVGYEVLTASGTGEALALVDGLSRLDVVVTDLVMPGGDGASLAATLRERFPAAAIVIASGFAEEAALAEASDAATVFLQKPFDVRELSSAIRAAA